MACKLCGINPELKEDDLCKECRDEMLYDRILIDELMDKGHPHHCASRQIWGDGECECDLYKLGYNPYKWQSEKPEGE